MQCRLIAVLFITLFFLIPDPAEARHRHHHRHHWHQSHHHHHHAKRHYHRWHHFARGRQVSVRGLVAPLARKIASIQNSCGGTSVISAVRRTYIAGTGRISLHALGKAADVKGKFGCIYAQLRGWPGGYSIDAGRVNHIHISYDYRGREWGIRFRHGGGGYASRRGSWPRYYAHRHYRIALR